ncbi:hypothetical protein [Leifsonia sp. Le1]|uniref:hypothetical protein n=1 Tax=Leifsonia sp. Le1 TaxID=3404918 RepID=UPI003EBAB5E3
MTGARRLVAAVGIALIGCGVVFFAIDLTIGEIAGVVVWLAGAVIIHDAVLVPVVTAVDAVLRRAGRRLPSAVVMVVELGLAVGALLTAMVVPEVIAQARGPRNPTVVPGDYGQRLAVLWVAIVVLVALASAVIGWRARRSARRSRRS